MLIASTEREADPPPQDAPFRDALLPDDIIVTGHSDGRATAAKMDIPVLENSQAVTVLSEARLIDQGAIRLGEALRNVAGVSRSDVYGFFDGFNIRGFDASSSATYLDGLRDGTNMATSEVSGLEKLEVVKGPASGLFGQGPLSGIVNLVSKRPQQEAFLDVGLTGGSYNYREIRADANGPVTADGTLLARLYGVYRDQDFFVDFSGAKRVYLAPSLTWRPDAQTSLTFLGLYERDKINPWSPTTAYGTVLPNPNGPLPRSRSVNDGAYPAEQTRRYINLGYMFDHRFSDAVAIHQGVRWQDFSQSWDHWLFVGGIDPTDMRTISRYYYGPYQLAGHDLRIDTNLDLTFATGPVKHHVILGVDYGRRTDHYTSVGDYDNPLFDMDIYNPVYGTVKGPNPTLQPFAGTDHLTQLGGYIQDHIKLGKRLTVTLGGRWDRATSGTGPDKVVDTAFSPRAGFTFLLSEGVAFYGNYAKSFNPQGGYNFFNGGTLPPENGVNYETGFKIATPDHRLIGTATIFQLTRENVATTDLAHPNFYVLTGAQRSRGLELELGFHPVPGLELSAAYTYLQAEITRDNDLLPNGGKVRLAGIPHHIVNLWGKYVIPSGALKGLGAGVGVHTESGTLASNYELVDPIYGRPFNVPGYTLLDLALYYETGSWSAQVNLKNALDKTYFVNPSSDRTSWGEPRTVMVSLQQRF